MVRNSTSAFNGLSAEASKLQSQEKKALGEKRISTMVLNFYLFLFSRESCAI
jgi:hypothetical protein